MLPKKNGLPPNLQRRSKKIPSNGEDSRTACRNEIIVRVFHPPCNSY